MHSVRPAPWQSDRVEVDGSDEQDALRAASTGIRNTRPMHRTSAKPPKMMNATMV